MFTKPNICATIEKKDLHKSNGASMEKVEIFCPDCGKLITKVSKDSIATIYGWCKVCKEEKEIPYRANEPKTR